MLIPKRDIFIHITCCVFFLSLPFIFSPELEFSFEIFQKRGAKREFGEYALILGAFYLNYFLLIPKLYFKKKYLLFILILIACFVTVITIPKTIIPWQVRNVPGVPDFFRKPPSILMQIDHNIFIFLMAIFVSMIIRINNRLKELWKEKLNAELSYMKAQINPHFLFNSLNSIYSLALEKSDKTPGAVVMLSGLMRYIISEANRDFVSLEKEMNHLKDYIELQKIRLDNTINIVFRVSGNTENKKIAPLILIPFVENAFKYGVNAEENSGIFITVEFPGNMLNFTVENNKVNSSLDHIHKSGVGIKNTKSRLELLYPAKHELVVNDGMKCFKVTLKLDLS